MGDKTRHPFLNHTHWLIFSIALVMVLVAFSRAFPRTPAIAWAAGEPQTTAVPPLDTQLISLH